MAAEDAKGKKRKSAQDSAPKAKKLRKSDDVAAVPKPAQPTKAAASTDAPKPVKTKPKRKEAADFFDDDDEAPAVQAAQDAPKATKGKKKAKDAAKANGDAPEPVAAASDALKAQDKPKKQGKKAKTAAVDETPATDAPVVEAPKEKSKKAKKGKQAESVLLEEAVVAADQREAPAKKSKKTKASKKQPEPVEETVDVAVVEEETDGDAEEDDQTAALLAGFESEEDEDDDENNKDQDYDVDFDENAAVPAVSKKQRTALEKALKGVKSNTPGVVYIGRVPRGFFEPQMKKYFSQFGKVLRVRLSRNKHTGASKHYAFVEFQSTEVADIVARTMDNYLLFGHILKCKLIPAEQIHPDLFKGAGQRFKVDPRNKKAGLQMERGVERGQWEKRVENENKRRTGRSKALKEEFGYEFSAPAVKSVESVPKQVENGTEEIQPATEKKGKKATKSKVATELDVQAEIAADIAAPTLEKKGKKDKKRKSDIALEPVTIAEEITVTEVTAPKIKKARKAKA